MNNPLRKFSKENSLEIANRSCYVPSALIGQLVLLKDDLEEPQLRMIVTVVEEIWESITSMILSPSDDSLDRSASLESERMAWTSTQACAVTEEIRGTDC